MEYTFQRGHRHWSQYRVPRVPTTVIHGIRLKAEQNLSLQGFSTAKIKCLELTLMT